MRGQIRLFNWSQLSIDSAVYIGLCLGHCVSFRRKYRTRTLSKKEKEESDRGVNGVLYVRSAVNAVLSGWNMDKISDACIAIGGSLYHVFHGGHLFSLKYTKDCWLPVPPHSASLCPIKLYCHVTFEPASLPCISCFHSQTTTIPSATEHGTIVHGY